MVLVLFTMRLIPCCWYFSGTENKACSYQCNQHNWIKTYSHLLHVPCRNLRYPYWHTVCTPFCADSWCTGEALSCAAQKQNKTADEVYHTANTYRMDVQCLRISCTALLSPLCWSCSKHLVWKHCTTALCVVHYLTKSQLLVWSYTAFVNKCNEV